MGLVVFIDCVPLYTWCDRTFLSQQLAIILCSFSLLFQGAMKALHLTSDTTAEQVVQALLNKYSIADNPMKFALFEKQNREEGHGELLCFM